MKKEYKDLMMKYLDEHPGIEVTSNPIGWYRHHEEIDGHEFDDRNSTTYTIRKGKIEHAMISLFLREKTPNYTSYKFKYDKDEKAFVGKIKTKSHETKNVNVEIEIPDNIWFNTADVNIVIKGKSSIKCDVRLIVKNGMFPPDMDDIRKRMENSICRQISEQLKGKGRVVTELVRQTYDYSKRLNMNFRCDVAILNNEDVTIKL